jgi:cytochrome c-type biogenesis protein CcmH
MRVLAILAAIVILAMPSALASGQQRASLPDVEDEVMCTVCGTLLEESQSPQAERERELIRRLIALGRDKQQIKDALVAQYGSRVLATPSGHGFDLAAWIVPGVVIGIAIVLLGVGASRLKRASRPRATSAPLDPADMERLDADLRRQDL